jgi:hypothetical protein
MFARRQLQWHLLCSKQSQSRLDGVVISVLATGPKGRGFKPDRGDVFLRATKIRSTPSFGGESKPSAPCSQVLRQVKDRLTDVRY